MSMSPEFALTDHLDDEAIIGYAVDAALAEAGVTFGEEFFTETETEDGRTDTMPVATDVNGGWHGKDFAPQEEPTETETGDVKKELMPVATDVNGGWHGNDFAPQETVEE
jgi:hypothetical protein